MVPSGFENTPARKLWSGFLDSPRAQLVAMAVFTALYVLTFITVPESTALIIAPLAMIPVVLAGRFFGIKAGLTAGVIAILLNAALYTFNLNNGWPLWNNTAWPLNIMFMLAGYISGAVKTGMDKQIQINKELQTRERYLSLINLSTQDILAHDVSDDRYYYLISHLVNLLVADYGHIVFWDEEHEKNTLVVSTKYSRASNVVDPQESELVASVLKSGQPLVFGNASNPDQLAGPGWTDDRTRPARSGICIPLIAKEHKLGAIILAFVASHQFSEEEIYYSELASKRIALTLWNALQDTEIQHRLHEVDALATIGRALSETERVGLDHVLQLIVDSAQELIPAAEQAVIHLVDEEQRVLIPRAVAGFSHPGESRAHMRLGEGVAGRVIAEGVPVNIADVTTDPQFLRQNTLPRFRSLMVSPLQSGEKRLGTISVQSDKTSAFTNEEMQLLSSLGIQASIAIENAHLLEITQQGLKDVNALYRITQGLAASLDTERLMEDVVELLQKSFGFYQVQVFVTDPENKEMILRAGSGTIGEQLKNHRLPAGGGIVGHAAETGAAFFTNDVDNVVFYIRHPLLPDTRSELSVPIKVNERVVGVLDIQQCPPNRLTEHNLQLVSTVADQLAVALQKASLYSDLQTSLAQETSMRSQLIQSERLALVGRLLASVSHELNNPLQAIQNALFLLQEEKGISPQGRQDLQIVLSEAERMAGLIDRLRTSYRSTRVEDMQPVHINNVIEDVYALMATHLRHNNIAFEFHPDPNLPLIAGLPDQIRQVILNLLMNGVDAMPSGGRLIVSTQLLENKEVLLTVADTGSGIETALLPHIFDAFVTNKESGTGLGLTITYDIIHRHNGRIRAENNPDRGATFKIWLQTYAREISQ